MTSNFRLCESAYPALSSKILRLLQIKLQGNAERKNRAFPRLISPAAPNLGKKPAVNVGFLIHLRIRIALCIDQPHQRHMESVLLVAYICYVLHVVIVYSTTVRTLGGMSPLKFFKGMAPAMLFAFSSASSVGTLPLNLECCENMGVSKEVSSFVLPLGATINMDGTAIYQGVCSIFIAACYGITLTPTQMLTIVLTATLASIGTAGVPGAGMVMLSMVLQSVGLPVEGIALVAGVDRIFDMGRTTVNITGDASCAVIVSHLQEKRNARRAAKEAKKNNAERN